MNLHSVRAIFFVVAFFDHLCGKFARLADRNKTCELVKKLKPKKVYVNFIIELKDLNGKSVFGDDVEVESVLTL